ncbi:MAG: glutaredoxin family protein [Bermanella sp.]
MKLVLMLVLTVSTLMSVLMGSDVSAEVFKWTDESGRTHYSDKVKENQPLQTIKAEVNLYTDVPIDYIFASSASGKGKKVIMYSTSWCGYCAQARKYFKKKGIPYIDYDIEKNKKAKRKYDILGGVGVPLILVGKKSMTGFSIPAFNDIYK